MVDEEIQYKLFIGRQDELLWRVMFNVRSPTLRSFESNSSDSVSCQGSFYSAVGAYHTLMNHRDNSDPNNQSAAFILGETRVVQSVQTTPVDGFNIVAALFYTSSMFCLHAVLFAILARWHLSNHSLRESGSVIERRADLQRKLDTLKKWHFNLPLQAPMFVLLAGLLLLGCGALSMCVAFRRRVVNARSSLS